MSDSQLAILFSDVAGSTSLYETLGDNVARKLIAQCIADMSDSIVSHKGTVIKTIGDEIMCTFPSADDAVRSAMEMQEQVTDGVVVDGTPYPLSIRIGLHFGSVIHEKGDVFGDAVNVAARMAQLAKGGQIITTADTVKSLHPMLKVSARLLDRLSVKGKAQTMEIHEVVWQEDDVTHIASGVVTNIPTQRASLRLVYSDKEVKLDANSPGFSMGRGSRADLMVEESLASREHVLIETRRGKFVLLDKSTNGTYVLDDNDKSTYLRREEMVLSGSGKISLGRDFAQNPEEYVRYYCEE